MADRSDDTSEEARGKRRAKMAAGAKKLNQNPALLTAAKLVRQLLPGDSKFGDPLSTAGKKQAEIAGRRLSELTAERPGVLREAGLTALQVWQAMSEAQGRGQGDEELAIVFTDLVGFSDWALEAGDDVALDLLRDVGEAMEPCVTAHDGEVVKRLGDGLMAVFKDPQDALAAIIDMREELDEVEAPGYDPCFRAGLHLGQPRKLGGDYLGIDVNIAARVAEQAGGDELLVSDRALEALDQDGLDVKRKRRFNVKGVPADMTAYRVAPRGGD
jgi:adenylate cyclase